MKLQSASPKTKIRHRNEINSTFSQLPLSSRRILFMALAQIDTKKLIPDGEVYRISAKEYADIADVNISSAYRQLKQGAEDLQRSTLPIPKSELLIPFKRAGDPLIPRAKESHPKDTIYSLNITEYCAYSESGAFVEIRFTRTMEPYISKLAGGYYTTQVLLSAARLSENNSSSLYQLLRKNISQGKFKFADIEINTLKDELNLFTLEDGEKKYFYDEYKIFNRDFLKKSTKAIRETTELKDLDYQVIEKQARKASKLRFTYSLADEKISLPES